MTAASYSGLVLSTASISDRLSVALGTTGMQSDPEAGLKLASKAVKLRPGLRVLSTSGQGMTDGMVKLFVENSDFLPKPDTVDQRATRRRRRQPRRGLGDNWQDLPLSLGTIEIFGILKGRF